MSDQTFYFIPWRSIKIIKMIVDLIYYIFDRYEDGLPLNKMIRELKHAHF